MTDEMRYLQITLYVLLKLVGKSQLEDHIKKWHDYIKDHGWNCLGLHPSKMQSVLVDGEEWRLNLELLPLQSSRKNHYKEEK